MALRWHSRAVGLAFFLFSIACADDSQTSELEKKLADAQAEVAKLQQELAQAKGAEATCVADQEHSVLSVASTYHGIATDAVQHILDQTSLDDHAYVHANTVHVMVRDALGYVTDMDIQDLMDKVKKNELYITNVAPVIDTISLKAQPLINQHVTPLLEQAKPHVEAITAQAEALRAQALLHTEPAVAAAQEKLTKVREQSFQELFGGVYAATAALEAKIEAVVLAPIFSFVERASPNRIHILPKSTKDRVLLLILSILALVYCFYVVKFALNITFKVTWPVLTRAFCVTVKLPAKLFFRVVSFAFCIFTCCGCCGLCRRSGKVQAASVDEIQTLLQRAKDKNKLEAAIKVFKGVAGRGMVMDAKKFGDLVDGKTVSIDVLRKATKKFPELDVKKLGL